jgi:hypothetical protein
VLANSVRTVESEIWSILQNKELERITEIKEMNIEHLFDDNINVTRYTLSMYNPNIDYEF